MIYLITHRGQLKDEEWLDRIYELIAQGIECIIIRERSSEQGNSAYRSNYERRRIKKLTQEIMAYKMKTNSSHTKVIVHSNIGLAKEVGADGIHLPYTLWESYQKSLSVKKQLLQWEEQGIIGISVHSLEEAIAVQDIADYILLSPVFKPSCKKVEGKGLQWFGNIQQTITTQVVALGGITKDNVQTVYDAGICHIAVMSQLMDTNYGVNDFRNKRLKAF